jgi:hypothetical protein
MKWNGRLQMKKLIVAALCVTILLFIYDFVVKEFPSPLMMNGPGTSQNPFRGKLQLSSVKYDLPSHRIKTDIRLELTATSDAPIKSLSFSPLELGDHQGRSWLLSAAQDCKMETFDKSTGGGKSVSAASFDCSDVMLTDRVSAKEIWYPFDSYEVLLFPRACVNNSGGACTTHDNASIDTFEAIVADQNFVGVLTASESSPGAYTLVLSRKFFVRMVSVIFLVFSLIFLVYLVAAGDPKDLLPKSLGFFATLWGLRSLIVPSSVSVFPTIVDYCILTIFCLLFLLVFMKLYPRSQP